MDAQHESLRFLLALRELITQAVRGVVQRLRRVAVRIDEPFAAALVARQNKSSEISICVTNFVTRQPAVSAAMPASCTAWNTPESTLVLILPSPAIAPAFPEQNPMRQPVME